MPFIDTAELADILGEAHATVHRALTGLLDDGIIGRVSHGAAHLPSSGLYYLTAEGIGEAAVILGFATPSDFVRAYPMSREWLTLLIRRMDAVASVYRLTVPRHPIPPFARGVPPQGPLRRHHHPPRRPQLRRGPLGPGPAAAFPLRLAESHSGVRLHTTPRHRSHPGSQRLGAEADGEVLRAHLSQGLLRRRASGAWWRRSVLPKAARRSRAMLARP